MEPMPTLPGLRVTSHFAFNLLVLTTALTFVKATDSLSMLRKHHSSGGGLDTADLKVHLIDGNSVQEDIGEVGKHRDKSYYQLLFQSEECVGCPFWVLGSRLKDGQTFKVNATFRQKLRVTHHDGNVKSNLYSFEDDADVCDLTKQFWDKGVYQLTIHENGDKSNNTKCTLETLIQPSNPFLPILYAFIVLFAVPLLLSLIYNSRTVRKCFVNLWVRHWQSQNSGGEEIIPSTNDSQEENRMTMSNGTATVAAADTAGGGEEAVKPDTPRIKRRVKSLDAFRGMAIVIMIFVNYGGGGYWFFNHSRWNGLTVADLVFPWFMWIMGVSTSIATRSRLRNSIPRFSICLAVLKRSCILFFLGLVINSLKGRNDLSNLRIPGVLQRFAITYCVVAILEALLMARTEDESIENGSLKSYFKDILNAGYQWKFVLAFVAAHEIVMFVWPYREGCPTGYLGPGGLHEGGKYANCTGGAAGAVDKLVFGSHHIYQRPSPRLIYSTTMAFDPEGLLGCLTAIFTVYLGVQAGKTLLSYQGWDERVKRWLLWSLAVGLVAGGLCGFSKDDGVIPVNKNLWSLSFATATSSMAFFLLAVMYLLIDVFGIWSGCPFVYPGMNSILLYMGHEICHDFFPFSWKPYTNSHAELLGMNLWGTALWVLIAFVLFKKRIFLAL